MLAALFHFEIAYFCFVSETCFCQTADSCKVALFQNFPSKTEIAFILSPHP